MNFLGKPTMEFCEKAGVGLIKRPFYALSNLAYLFVGALILSKRTKLSFVFGSLTILVGAFSFFYDASYTYGAQLLDLFGMFLFANLLLYLSARRLLKWNRGVIIFFQILLILKGMFLVIFLKSFWGDVIFGEFVLAVLVMETISWQKKEVINFRLFTSSLLLFFWGFLIWMLDAGALVCDPTNIVNGRSIFHILTAIAIYQLYKYYELQNINHNDKLVNKLKNGEVSVLPTDTIYGIVGSAFNENTVNKIYAIRKRAPEKPCIVLIGSIAELNKFDIHLSDLAHSRLEALWDKREATSVIIDCKEEKFKYLHRGTQTLAFRLPYQKVLREFLQKTGPIIAPSANTEGSAPAETIKRARRYFENQVNFYVDGGRVIGKPSQVIRLFSNGETTIIRP